MTCETWPITWPCDTAGVDADLLEAAHDLAEQLLWSLSGYRIGVCQHVESFWPNSVGACGGTSSGSCCRVTLDQRPIQSIVEVVDGGRVLEPTEYVVEGSYLRRRGGCWSTAGPCDDPELIVTYQAGMAFPAGTPAAVGEVACEYLSALQNQPCRLPSRATSITRQGVTVTLDTAADFVNRRRIGLPVTDAWLESVIGGGPRVASRVYVPRPQFGDDAAAGSASGPPPTENWVQSTNDTIADVQVLTKAEHTALAPPSPKTVYYIIG